MSAPARYFSLQARVQQLLGSGHEKGRYGPQAEWYGKRMGWMLPNTHDSVPFRLSFSGRVEAYRLTDLLNAEFPDGPPQEAL